MQPHCIISSCKAPYEARGFCKKHYARWRRHGNPFATSRIVHPGTYEQRFWAKVNKTETCWLWTANKTIAGYGSYKVNGKTLLTHRLAYELLLGSFLKPWKSITSATIGLALTLNILKL